MRRAARRARLDRVRRRPPRRGRRPAEGAVPGRRAPGHPRRDQAATTSRRVIDEIADEVGDRGLQALVNNAGVGVGGPVEYVTEDDWRWVFDVNFFGVVALTRSAIPLLRAGHGRIVHIGSIGGRLASPGLAPYSASKHALEALAEAQRHEFARSGTPIRVALDRARRGQDRDLGQGRAPRRRDRARARRRRAAGATSGSSTSRAASSTRAARRACRAAKVADAVEHALTASQAEGALPRRSRRQARGSRPDATPRPAPRRAWFASDRCGGRSAAATCALAQQHRDSRRGATPRHRRAGSTPIVS